MAEARTVRSTGTREAIMAAAERLYAEHGLVAVSNRQIGEAAGQGNVAAVGYHFGTRADLVRAIMGKHSAAIERIRQRMLEETRGSREVRDWVACLVRPAPEHLATLGLPSWYARFAVQVMTDPLLRAIVTDEALTREPLRETLYGLGRCLDALPAEVRAERGDMARQLITHTCAERERALAEGTSTRQPSWDDTAGALTDAITGLLLAPVTPRSPAKEARTTP
ncbi:TetR/AcrR family transcriptional regulator [Streptomyces sp. 4503]|uniref:TetR/AcrR family transcriptional regulator n=2 Tax=Streptomyces niphimycinicus TaxID=2842201 RepID=A0ABS6CHZ5_9ACTN|nr:TetR/AcrR family transcriptional regulator [Streptomyces niphimycinicus]